MVAVEATCGGAGGKRHAAATSVGSSLYLLPSTVPEVVAVEATGAVRRADSSYLETGGYMAFHYQWLKGQARRQITHLARPHNRAS